MDRSIWEFGALQVESGIWIEGKRLALSFTGGRIMRFIACVA